MRVHVLMRAYMRDMILIMCECVSEFNPSTPVKTTKNCLLHRLGGVSVCLLIYMHVCVCGISLSRVLDRRQCFTPLPTNFEIFCLSVLCGLWPLQSLWYSMHTISAITVITKLTAAGHRYSNYFIDEHSRKERSGDISKRKVQFDLVVLLCDIYVFYVFDPKVTEKTKEQKIEWEIEIEGSTKSQ